MAIPLRDEILFLRQLLGYAPGGRLAADPGRDPRLPGSSMWDVLFVGIDIDTTEGYEALVPDQQLHIGLSVLDTRALQRATTTATATAPEDAIRSHQYTIGTSVYCRQAARRFLFGPSEPLASPADVPARFAALVPPDRAVVFVLHGAREDLKLLTHLGVPRTPLCVVDTVKAAQTPLRLTHRYGLEALLDALAIPYKHLHAAGNDAHYALRALLMLAVVDGAQVSSNSSNPLFSVLRAIAQAPRPLTRHEREGPADAARQKEAAAQKLAAVQERNRQRRARRAAKSERRRLSRERRREQAEAYSLPSTDGHDGDPEDVEEIFPFWTWQSGVHAA